MSRYCIDIHKQCIAFYWYFTFENFNEAFNDDNNGNNFWMKIKSASTAS